MREGTRNFMVGLMSILALVGLAALLMSFGELDPLLNPRYMLTIRTTNAAGLRPGGNIEFNGVPIGVVHDVTIESDPHWPVRIVCLIDADTKIPADVEPFASAPLIGGSGILQLQAPPDGAAARGDFLPDDGGAMFSGPIRGGLLAQITEQLDQRMKPLVASLEKFNQLSETYIALGNNLNDLLKPQGEEQLTTGEPPNLRTAVVKLNAALDEAREGLELAKSFLGDEQLQDDARSALTKANTLIDRATTAVERYAKLAESLQGNSEELTKRLLPVTDSLAATLEDVRRLAKLAAEGQGTLGQLLNNPDLYKSLNDAAVRLERTLVEVQLLVEKLKQEGVDINL
jgi:phospholipid/cholesterol/gamma-HCH transport system substrate-binding protein